MMVAIVTDSTVYIKKAEADGMGLIVAPIAYSADGRDYLESYIDDCGDYIGLFKSSAKRQTAQVGLGSFLSVFSKLLSSGHEVLCITLSSHLSGTYASACAAAEELGDRVKVVDSLSTAGGLYTIVKKACALAADGMALAPLCAAIEAYKKRIAIVFSVDDLTPLYEGGRLGSVGRTVGNLLNLKPLLLCDNAPLVAAGIARGKKEQIKKMVSRVPKGADKLFIHFVEDTAGAEEIAKSLREAGLSNNPAFLQIGPVLAAHLGLGIIGVGWEKP